MTGRRRKVAVGAAVAGLLGVGWWSLDEGPAGPDDPCAGRSRLVQATTAELVPRAELLPEGSVGDERRPVVRAVDALGRALGTGGVVAGRFFPGPADLPALVPLDDAVPGALLLARAPDPARPGSLTAVRLPGGDPAWARTFAGTTPGGGLVGDHLVTVLGPERRAAGTRPPAVLTLDPRDGSLVACVAPAVDQVVLDQDASRFRMLADQAGTDVVVAAVVPGRAVTLSRVAPAEGRVVWGRQTDGLTEAGSVTVTGPGPDGAVLLGRLGHDPVRLVEEAAAADRSDRSERSRPDVAAYSLDDGDRVWTFPRPADRTAAMVVGADPDTGATVVVTARRGAAAQTFPRVSLVVLDPAGRPVWSRALGRGFWHGELWGSSVVLRGPDPRGGAGATLLRAHALEDGRRLWTVRSREAPPRGTEPREGFGPGVALGGQLGGQLVGQYVVPAPNGLLQVDPATGRVARLDSDVAVDQVLPVGDLVLVRTGNALLVLGG